MPVYNYTTFDNPSATIGTFGNAINDSGQIVGYYQNSTSLHGFLYSAAPTPPSTIPWPPTRPPHKASTTQARSSVGTVTVVAITASSSPTVSTLPSTIPRPPSA